MVSHKPDSKSRSMGESIRGMVILLPGLGECLIFSRPQIWGQFISDFLPVKFGECSFPKNWGG